MALDQLWLFLSITLVVSASPGPVMLTCMVDAGRYGFRQSLYTMLGASLGNVLLMLLSALGLSVIVTQSPWFFYTLQWLGAAYLVYLGAQLMRALPLGVELAASTIRPHQLFSKSLWVAMSNPKGLVYFGALFPQFIATDRPLGAQFALLTVIFLAIDLVWMTAYALGGRSIMRWLKSPSHQLWFNWASGAVLIAAGIALAFTKL